MGLIQDFSHDEAQNFDGKYALVEGVCERFTKWLGEHGYAITPKKKVRTIEADTFPEDEQEDLRLHYRDEKVDTR